MKFETNLQSNKEFKKKKIKRNRTTKSPAGCSQEFKKANHLSKHTNFKGTFFNGINDTIQGEAFSKESFMVPVNHEK